MKKGFILSKIELFKLESLDLKGIIGSDIDSKQLCDAIAHLGLREMHPFQTRFDNVIEHIRKKKELNDEFVEDEYVDDYNVMTGTLIFLGKFFDSVTRFDPEVFNKLVKNLEGFSEELHKFEPVAKIV